MANPIMLLPTLWSIIMLNPSGQLPRLMSSSSTSTRCAPRAARLCVGGREGEGEGGLHGESSNRHFLQGAILKVGSISPPTVFTTHLVGDGHRHCCAVPERADNHKNKLGSLWLQGGRRRTNVSQFELI